MKVRRRVPKRRDRHPAGSSDGEPTSYLALLHMGIPVHHHDSETCLDTIEGFVRTGRRTGRSFQVATVNTDFLVQARMHSDVHSIIRNADLAIADGMPLLWSSRALGQRLPSRIAGADLVPALAERAAASGLRMMFFGGAPGVAERAAQVLRDSHPKLSIAAVCDEVGPNSETTSEALDVIRGFRPDVLCVALGHPKQERWIRDHAGGLEVPVAIGVGGTFDFLAGDNRRAAGWIQQSGLEWVFRLSQEPARLSRRYMIDIAVYIPQTIREILRTRLAGARRGSGGVAIVSSGETALIVELCRPGPIDHLTSAELTSLATRCRREGRRLGLVVPEPSAVRSLQKLGLDRLIPLVPRVMSRRDRTPVSDGSAVHDAQPVSSLSSSLGSGRHG